MARSDEEDSNNEYVPGSEDDDSSDSSSSHRFSTDAICRELKNINQSGCNPKVRATVARTAVTGDHEHIDDRVDENHGDGTSNNSISSGFTPETPANSSGLVQKTERAHDFFRGLPKLPSHYSRKNSQKLYLQTDIKSYTQLYELYQLDCKKEKVKAVSRNTFDRIRKLQNIALYKPKKDRCDLCYSYENKITGSSDSYLLHRTQKERAQEEKEKDKAAAIDGHCHPLSCDLMAVQTVPYIRASSAYYKLKLTMHNFTVYDLATHDAMNYWFDESESNLKSSTFASFLVDYVKNLLDVSLKTVIIYSDECGYQNRNVILANALFHLSVEKKVTIIQKLLVKGHTYMECDSVHSTVENAFKDEDISLPHNYVQFSKTARKNPMPYRAMLVDHTFYKDFGREEMMAYTSVRPGKRVGDPVVNDLRTLQHNPDGTISYKLDFSDELQDIPCRPTPVTRLIAEFPRLHQTRPKIPKDKFSDLQWFKDKIPPDTHSYYGNLHCETKSRRETKRKTGKSKKSDDGNEEEANSIVRKKSKKTKRSKV